MKVDDDGMSTLDEEDYSYHTRMGGRMKGRFCVSCAYCVRVGATLWCAENDERIDGIKVCDDYEPIIKPKTNGDCIRAMTDEELAEWLATAIAKHYDIQAVVPNRDSVLWLEWLKQEARNELH